jgi:hypothetical protein
MGTALDASVRVELICGFGVLVRGLAGLPRRDADSGLAPLVGGGGVAGAFGSVLLVPGRRACGRGRLGAAPVRGAAHQDGGVRRDGHQVVGEHGETRG